MYLAEATDFRLITPSSYPTPYGWLKVDSEFNRGVPIQTYPIQFLHIKRTATRWLLRSRDLDFPKFQPDIIHVEMEPHGWITCQALLYRKWFAPHAKVVVFVYENLTLEEQGVKAHMLEYLARFNRSYIDFFICAGGAGKQILMDSAIPEEKIAVMPQYGVDPDVFCPYSAERKESCRRDLGISPAEFAIGFVGRFVESKGLLDLVDATAKLKSASGRPIALVLTGSGELEQALRLRCAELGIRLKVHPARKYYQIPESMNALDVLVLPSQSRQYWKEQFGRVLVEAMACGTLAIGSDSGEIPNVIGDAGMVFAERDCEQLFQCLKLCCENETLRTTLAARGLERVLANYTNRRIAEQTLEIYGRLTGSDNGRDSALRTMSASPMSGV